MTYLVVGLSDNGKRITQKYEALDLDELKSKLITEGITYRTIKEITSRKTTFLRTKKISYFELSKLCQNLSNYLKSGISLTQTIKLSLNLYEDNKIMSNFLSSVIASLEDGNSFYVAMDSQNILKLPPFFLESIKVSSASGVLAEVLEELAGYLKKQHRISKEIQNAFAYPVFLLVVSVLMIVFMLNFLVPKITSLFEQNSQELPTLTVFVIASSDFFKSYWLLILAVILIFSILFIALYRISSKFQYKWDHFILKIPFIGQIVKFNILARFSYIVSTLVRSGVNFVHALSLAKGVMGNKFLEDIVSKSLDKVISGAKFSTSLAVYRKDLDKTFVQSLILAEESGNIDDILYNTSILYFEQNQDRTKMFLALLEPFLMLTVGLSVGLIVIAMMLPIFSFSLG